MSLTKSKAKIVLAVCCSRKRVNRVFGHVLYDTSLITERVCSTNPSYCNLEIQFVSADGECKK